MTWEEVKATGADIIRFALTSVPTSGWREVTVAELQQLHDATGKLMDQLATEGRNAELHQEASTEKVSAADAIAKAKAGARVFTVAWNGTRAFAATKV